MESVTKVDSLSYNLAHTNLSIRSRESFLPPTATYTPARPRPSNRKLFDKCLQQAADLKLVRITVHFRGLSGFIRRDLLFVDFRGIAGRGLGLVLVSLL